MLFIEKAVRINPLILGSDGCKQRGAVTLLCHAYSSQSCFHQSGCSRSSRMILALASKDMATCWEVESVF